MRPQPPAIKRGATAADIRNEPFTLVSIVRCQRSAGTS